MNAQNLNNWACCRSSLYSIVSHPHYKSSCPVNQILSSRFLSHWIPLSSPSSSILYLVEGERLPPPSWAPLALPIISLITLSCSQSPASSDNIQMHWSFHIMTSKNILHLSFSGICLSQFQVLDWYINAKAKSSVLSSVLSCVLSCILSRILSRVFSGVYSGVLFGGLYCVLSGLYRLWCECVGA